MKQWWQNFSDLINQPRRSNQAENTSEKPQYRVNDDPPTRDKVVCIQNTFQTVKIQVQKNTEKNSKHLLGICNRNQQAACNYMENKTLSTRLVYASFTFFPKCKTALYMQTVAGLVSFTTSPRFLTPCCMADFVERSWKTLILLL